VSAQLEAHVDTLRAQQSEQLFEQCALTTKLTALHGKRSLCLFMTLYSIRLQILLLLMPNFVQ